MFWIKHDMLLIRRAYQSTIFLTFGSVAMKVHPIPHAIFETTRPGFIKFCMTVQFHERELLCIFVAQTFYTLNKKSSWNRNFQTFEWLGENPPNYSCRVWKHNSVFFLTLHHSSVSWGITLLYISAEMLHNKDKRNLSKCKVTTAHVKFLQICTLIGSICWKYIKFQLKKYRGFMSYDTEVWCKIRRKTNFLFQKWQEF